MSPEEFEVIFKTKIYHTIPLGYYFHFSKHINTKSIRNTYRITLWTTRYHIPTFIHNCNSTGAELEKVEFGYLVTNPIRQTTLEAGEQKIPNSLVNLTLKDLTEVGDREREKVIFHGEIDEVCLFPLLFRKFVKTVRIQVFRD